jgi:hypothetical protein
MSDWSLAVAGVVICALGLAMLLPSWLRDLRAWLGA